MMMIFSPPHARSIIGSDDNNIRGGVSRSVSNDALPSLSRIIGKYRTSRLHQQIDEIPSR